MTGGIIQLVAYGQQDIFLTQDPQITFFKNVYRRHTNFTLEVIPQTFISKPDFGKRVTCVLSRNGDLIKQIHLVIELPAIPEFRDEDQNIDLIAKFAWVRKIGYAIIKTVEIEIGGELIDRQYGDWLNIWHELTITDGKDFSKMLGNIEELTDFTNGKPSYKLYIPLQFWFNRIAGLALPIVSLTYDHIKLNLELSDFEKCYILAPTNLINIENDFVNFNPHEYLIQTVDGVTSLARFVYFDILNRTLFISRISDNIFISPCLENDLNDRYLIRGLTSGFQVMPRNNSIEKVYRNRSIDFKKINLRSCFLLVEYGFLDDEERIRFAQARHEYLIEQILYNGQMTIDGLHQPFRIGFSQPCKELIWVTQLTLAKNLRNNDIFNYTDSMIRNERDELVGCNLILKETILFNSLERISIRDSQYFNWLQPYQHHSHAPQEGINVYSFAIHPENHQPSGTANLSRIDNVILKLIMSPIINFHCTAKLRIYGIVYNVLRIANGVSAILWTFDN